MKDKISKITDTATSTYGHKPLSMSFVTTKLSNQNNVHIEYYILTGWIFSYLYSNFFCDWKARIQQISYFPKSSTIYIEYSILICCSFFYVVFVYLFVCFRTLDNLKDILKMCYKYRLHNLIIISTQYKDVCPFLIYSPLLPDTSYHIFCF